MTKGFETATAELKAMTGGSFVEILYSVDVGLFTIFCQGVGNAHGKTLAEALEKIKAKIPHAVEVPVPARLRPRT